MPRLNARLATALFRNHIQPLMQAEGFTGGSRNFQYLDPRGGRVLVGFQPTTGTTSGYEFYINVALSPAPWIAYIHEREEFDLDQVQRPEDGLLTARVNPPDGLRWVIFDLDGVARCGALIVELLQTRIHELKALLDPDQLLDRIRHNRPLPATGDLWTAHLLLLAEAGGPMDEFEALLPGFDDNEVSRDVADWARRRAQAAAQRR